jgi:hypothetical protein
VPPPVGIWYCSVVTHLVVGLFSTIINVNEVILKNIFIAKSS